MDEDAKNITLDELCHRFRLFAASQMRLYYTEETVRALFASMGTSKIIILEGISGTGKTSMPYCLGRFFKNPATICSVQPSWHDRSELLGFYNDFTKRFTETDFLRAVYEAGYRQDPCLIVLDEMNLARIEYYFAEFLSVMEMPNALEWNIDLIPSKAPNDPAHIVDGKLHIEQNIWFIGTANNDDSTFTITDKVYDRAMSLFFDNKGIAFEAEHTQAMPITYEKLHELYEQAKNDYPLSQKTLDKFAELDDFVIRNFKLAFGNRILKQMHSFVPCYVACGGTELQAVDYIFESKILKKFEVLNVAFLRDELLALDKELTSLFGKNEFKRSRQKIQGLLKMNG
jgi:5-methylcytosine-specific restriction endonuclease McrBC GTP-binding regulatory subunit McrB